MDINEFIKENHITYEDEDIYVSTSLPAGGTAPSGDKFVVIVCTQGKMQVDMGGKHIEVRANDVLMSHTLMPFDDVMFSADFQCASVAFSHRYAVSMLTDEHMALTNFIRIPDNPLIHLTEEDNKMVVVYGNLVLFKLKQKGDPFFRVTLDALMRLTMLELMRYYTLSHRSNDEDVADDSNSTLFKRFILLLTQDNCKHRSVAYFASELCITPKYLSTVCRRESDKTPTEWIQQHITERIRHLLLHSNLSVKEIATKMDFPNLSFFGKYVRQHLGCSPTDFRANNKYSASSLEDDTSDAPLLDDFEPVV